MAFDIEDVLTKLTTPEKLSLLAGKPPARTHNLLIALGKDHWHTVRIDRLGIPSIRVCGLF